MFGKDIQNIFALTFSQLYFMIQFNVSDRGSKHQLKIDVLVFKKLMRPFNMLSCRTGYDNNDTKMVVMA